MIGECDDVKGNREQRTVDGNTPLVGLVVWQLGHEVLCDGSTSVSSGPYDETTVDLLFWGVFWLEVDGVGTDTFDLVDGCQGWL